MARYALLGVELAELDLDGLEVVVAVNALGGPYFSSLASKVDEVRLGMPEEYVEAVMRGVQRAGDVVGLPMHASLQFRWAAHGMVGSSRETFELASKLVFQLLTLPKGEAEREIVALFEQP